MNKKESSTSTGTFVETVTRSQGKTFLLYGDDLVFSLSLKFAASLMVRHERIALVDGCNKAGIHGLAKFAFEKNLQVKEFLERIYISRGFTCYQMEQAIVHELPAFLRQIRSRRAVIFGLLDTMYDEQAPFREVSRMLPRILEKVKRLSAAGITFLFASQEYNVIPRQRNNLLKVLKNAMDHVYKVTYDDHEVRLLIEREDNGKNTPHLYKHY